MMYSVYFYQEIEEQIKLYFGGISTMDGLKAMDGNQKINVTEIGVTLYKNYGWATENEMPNFDTVKDVIDFLEAEDDIGLIQFSADIINKGTFSSHDDGECSFVLDNKRDAIQIIKKLTPSFQSECIIAKLLTHQGMYL